MGLRISPSRFPYTDPVHIQAAAAGPADVAARRNHDYGESELKKPEKCPAADPECFYSPLHEARAALPPCKRVPPYRRRVCPPACTAGRSV